MVIGDQRGNSGEQSCRGRDKRFGDTRCHRSEAGRTRRAKTGEGINDAPYRAEETDEWRDASGCGEPGHAFFDSPDFFRGGKLHADDDGLETLQFCRRSRGTGRRKLALKFAVARGIDVGER